MASQSHTIRVTPTQAWAIYTIIGSARTRTEFPEYRDLLQAILDQIALDADEILCVECQERPRTTRTLVCRRCYYRHQKRLKRAQERA